MPLRVYLVHKTLVGVNPATFCLIMNQATKTGTGKISIRIYLKGKSAIRYS